MAQRWLLWHWVKSHVKFQIVLLVCLCWPCFCRVCYGGQWWWCSAWWGDGGVWNCKWGFKWNDLVRGAGMDRLDQPRPSSPSETATYMILIVCISKSKRGLKNKYHHQYISQIFHHCHGHDRHYDEQDDGEASKARTSSLKRSVSRRSSSSSRLSLLSKKVKQLKI